MTDNPNAQHFPQLMNYIRTELPFIDIGRVFIIYTPAGSPELWHVDKWRAEEDFYDGRRHFVWIKCVPNRRFEERF